MSELIKTTTSEQHGLVLRKYTKRVFYKKLWDDETINSRGHVTDMDGNPVATPFKKFFNIGENELASREFVIDRLINNPETMYRDKKWNGHLSICYKHNGCMINHTSGTFEHMFNSDDRRLIIQAGFNETNIPEKWTLMFEVIGLHDPHLMTDYHIGSLGDQGVVLLGVNLKCGTPVPRNEYISHFIEYGIRDLAVYGERVSVKTDMEELGLDPYDYIDFLYDQKNTEGFILVDESDNFRVKIKTKWFIRNRYLRQFNHGKVAQIFVDLFDSAEAYDKIPEELHNEYTSICDRYNRMCDKFGFVDPNRFIELVDMSLV